MKLSAAFLYQTGTASDDNMVVYICDQASKIGIELSVDKGKYSTKETLRELIRRERQKVVSLGASN